MNYNLDEKDGNVTTTAPTTESPATTEAAPAEATVSTEVAPAEDGKQTVAATSASVDRVPGDWSGSGI